MRKPDLRPTSFADVALEKGLTSPQGGNRNVLAGRSLQTTSGPGNQRNQRAEPKSPTSSAKRIFLSVTPPHGSSFSHYLVNADSKPAHQRRRGHGNPKRTPLHPTLLFQEKARPAHP